MIGFTSSTNETPCALAEVIAKTEAPQTAKAAVPTAWLKTTISFIFICLPRLELYHFLQVNQIPNKILAIWANDKKIGASATSS